ncbi:hypothetical protein [Salinicoccus albus]|uniref:hypothetical protein n=1 Tax=Salinicoccus albus TaxID=418756 RepID=UPI000364E7D9|nr:hypothetical protein [Salinicoccus albus]
MIQGAGFYIISVLSIIILSALVPLSIKKYAVMPLLTIVIMGLSAFIIPNFADGTNWQPLMGYACFLFILSIAVSIMMFVYARNRRKKKEVLHAENEHKSSEK